MAIPPDTDELRAAVFSYVERASNPYITKQQLQQFHFQGEQFPLIDPQKGIRKPSGWATVLSIASTRTLAEHGGYEDLDRDDGSISYRFMRPTSSDSAATNRALVATMDLQRPLLYLIEVDTSLYEPVYPVWFVDHIHEQTDRESIVVSALGQLEGELATLLEERAYTTEIRRRRLHQAGFRSRVLYAYNNRCCICRLARRGLLDSAHIIDDTDPDGLAIVPNGLTMCRIHHGAYDQYLIGIRPNCTVHVSQGVLDEEDGPMLTQALQAVHGMEISVPLRPESQPDPDRLEWKYRKFVDLSA